MTTAEPKTRESETSVSDQAPKSVPETKHSMIGSSTYAVPVPSELSALSRPLKPAQPCFAIDVECVATGPGHNARTVAHVALVNQWCQVVLNVYIKQIGRAVQQECRDRSRMPSSA
eukprot:TRINITY_DN9947_c0_g1_i4.p1 TRINITY_DN9947_c0_g1~~TRINITY_DN9947_c0_g1_i4.p1  ORF type:complete len:116 (-),score=13.90 TRINITY_DN9947_c0_g1_i4:11-358(-)